MFTAGGKMSNIQIINMDCMAAMKEMPDKAFDLAIDKYVKVYILCPYERR